MIVSCVYLLGGLQRYIGACVNRDISSKVGISTFEPDIAVLLYNDICENENLGNHCHQSSLLILATLRRFVLGTRKKQTIPASRASRLLHPQAMGTILVPHGNTSISYRGPCIAICIHTYIHILYLCSKFSE